MTTAKILKPINYVIYCIELYKDSAYIETVYCRHKYEAKLYCKKHNIKII